MTIKNSHLLLSTMFILLSAQFLSSCSTSQPYYFAKGTGSFKDPYKTEVKTNLPEINQNLTVSTSPELTNGDIYSISQSKLAENQEDAFYKTSKERIVIHRPTRKEIKQLKKRLEVVMDTTKKRDRVTIQTNEKKVDELRNEVEGLKNSVKAEKSGDKVVVSFDKPQSGLSKEAKILVIVVAALLLIGLLSLPIIGPVLGIVLGIAVVAAALALVLGVIEIN